MPSNALVFILATHHEAGDVLQKHQGDFALAAQLDEVRSFLRRLGKQDAVVGDDAHRHALDMGEAAHQGAAKTWFEFMQLRAVHHPRNDFTHVIGLAGVGGNHAMQLLHVEKRRTGFLHRQLNVFASIQARHSLAGQGNRVGIVVGQMVGHARQTGVHIAAAQIFGGHNFTNRSFHQRWSAQEDGALVFHDDGFIAHGRHISTARRAAAHDHCDLGNALGAHVGLVVEDAAKVFFIWKHIVLVGQVGPARVHQVDAWQLVLLRNFLRPQMFFHRHRVVSAALDCRVIANNDAIDPTDAANARDDTCTRRVAVVHAVRRQWAEL